MNFMTFIERATAIIVLGFIIGFGIVVFSESAKALYKEFKRG